MRRLFGALIVTLAACGLPPDLPLRMPNAVAAAPTHAERTFSGNGVALYAQSWRPATPPRAVVVVVHGLKDHSDRYAELAARLVDKGIAVHALDLRGHARSAGERVWVDHFYDYTDDLALFLADVQKLEGDKPIFLFGHSMGGAIVTLFTITHRPAIAGFVLSAPALHADVSWFKVTGTWLANGLGPHGGVFQLDLDKFSRDPKIVQACKDDPFVYQPGAPAHTAHELLLAIDTIESRLPEIDAPFLAMHGSADEITAIEGSRALAAKARSTDKKIQIYDGLVHDLIHEPEKDRVLGDVVTWIDSHAPKP